MSELVLLENSEMIALSGFYKDKDPIELTFYESAPDQYSKKFCKWRR